MFYIHNLSLSKGDPSLMQATFILYIFLFLEMKKHPDMTTVIDEPFGIKYYLAAVKQFVKKQILFVCKVCLYLLEN